MSIFALSEPPTGQQRLLCVRGLGIAVGVDAEGALTFADFERRIGAILEHRRGLLFRTSDLVEIDGIPYAPGRQALVRSGTVIVHGAARITLFVTSSAAEAHGWAGPEASRAWAARRVAPQHVVLRAGSRERRCDLIPGARYSVGSDLGAALHIDAPDTPAMLCILSPYPRETGSGRHLVEAPEMSRGAATAFKLDAVSAGLPFSTLGPCVLRHEESGIELRF